MFPEEDDWFKEVNEQKTDSTVVNAEDKSKELNNTELHKALSSISKVDLNNMEDFKKYSKIHDDRNEGPFTCTVCNMGFEKEYRLKHHYNNHTDISTNDKVYIPIKGPDGLYKCTVCESAINNVSNYRKHFKRIHIKALKRCDECDFSTTTNEGLKGHKLRKHGFPDTYTLGLQKSL